MLRAKSPFDYGERVILCTCGQIINGPDGGPGACAACGRMTFFRPRAAYLGKPCIRTPGAQAPNLRRDAEPRELPGSIASLWDGGLSIPAHRSQEAFAIWQQVRTRAHAAEEACRELLLLTIGLADCELDRDPYRARALLERTLEAELSPRGKDRVLGALVRMAVRVCDLRAADRWIRHMLPSDELASDSEWRVSAAAVAILRERPETVVAALGAGRDAVVVHESLDVLAAVFRAHALEKLDRMDAACAEIGYLLSQGAAIRQQVESIMAMYRSLRLCPLSLPFAAAAQRRRSRPRNQQRSPLARLLVASSLLPLVLMAPMLAMQAGERPGRAAVGESGGAAIPTADRGTLGSLLMGLGLAVFVHMAPLLGHIAVIRMRTRPAARAPER